MSSAFQQFLQNKGIISQRSCPYTPQQNGVAERKNRHLLDVTRSLLLESSVPTRFWVEALATAVHLINRMPTTTLENQSPYYRLYKTTPSYDDLHVFGSTCFVHLPSSERTKLTAQSAQCVFLGYAPFQKGFLCYDPHIRRFRTSRNVVLFENQYFFQTHIDLPKPSSVSLPGVSDDSSVVRFNPNFVYHRRNSTTPTTALPPDLPPVPGSGHTSLRRSTRISVPPDRYGFSHTSLMATLSSSSIPQSYSQAVQDPCWNKAMQEELDALAQNHTWDIVPSPVGVKPIGCKWVFSLKLKSDGSLDRYKARLVALGNRQEYGIDYDETFAPVAKMTTVRTILAVAASQSWPLYQMDVKNAFLHGDLQEDVYMHLPKGCSSNPGMVAKLRRSLYGLKQAPRAWFEKFQAALLRLDFRPSLYDPSMFLHHAPSGITILLVYVDDIVITGPNAGMIQQLQASLRESFQMKDLGPLHYFLGLEVH
ncbi:hypothetical protein AAC387_Pa04g2839 [Persea americana]